MNINFISRWGDPALDDYGYTHIPGFILRNMQYFVNTQNGEIEGITFEELGFIGLVMSFKFDTANSQARPTMATIARRASSSTWSTRRIKNQLIKKGVLQVENNEHRNEPDVYFFTELARQCRIWEIYWQSRDENDTESPVIPQEILDGITKDTQRGPCSIPQGGPVVSHTHNNNNINNKSNKVSKDTLWSEGENFPSFATNQELKNPNSESSNLNGDDLNTSKDTILTPDKENGSLDNQTDTKKPRKKRNNKKAEGVPPGIIPKTEPTEKQLLWQEWVVKTLEPFGKAHLFDGTNFKDQAIQRYIKAAAELKKTAESLQRHYPERNDIGPDLIPKLYKWMLDQDFPNFTAQAMVRWFPDWYIDEIVGETSNVQDRQELKDLMSSGDFDLVEQK